MFCFLFIPTADPPQITTHPRGLKDAVPGQPVAVTIQAEEMQPLNYQLQQKPRDRSEGWQVCDMERFPGADNSTLIIPRAQTLNEGSYRCTVSNCADSESSDSATLTLGELKYYKYVYVIEHMWSAVKVVVPTIANIHTSLCIENYLWILSHTFGPRKGFASQLLSQKASLSSTQGLLPRNCYCQFANYKMSKALMEKREMWT